MWTKHKKQIPATLNFLLHLIFIATFIILYIVSIVILKPFRVHRKRTVSTIALKISYLIYLIVFLLLAYLVLFYTRMPAKDDVQPNGRNPFIIYYVAVILAFFIPNLGIMLRRKFNKSRTQYNIIFIVINIITILVLTGVIFTFPWEL